VLIVVSALSGITDQLKAITAAADVAQRDALRDGIVARHQAMFAELGLNDHAPIHYWFERLDALVANVRAEAAALAWQAEVLALGELMSSTLGVAYLNACGLRPCGSTRASICLAYRYRTRMSGAAIFPRRCQPYPIRPWPKRWLRAASCS